MIKNKVYLVIEYYSYCEESWEKVIAACETLELADSIREERIKQIGKPDIKISEEEWNNMYNELLISDNMSGDDYEDFHKMFPQYSMEDIELAGRVYDCDNNIDGIRIEEVDYYGNKCN